MHISMRNDMHIIMHNMYKAMHIIMMNNMYLIMRHIMQK